MSCLASLYKDESWRSRDNRVSTCCIGPAISPESCAEEIAGSVMYPSLIRAARTLLLLLAWLVGHAAHAQVCAAPGKDGPATPSGIVNTYYQGNGDLISGATKLSLGASSGATGTVTVGDKLIIMQMQGADINTSDDERYGDGTGTAANQPLTTLSQANGYTALNLAGGFEYVQVSAATGGSITFTPPLVNNYQQNLTVQPRRTYQVIRVPQYASMTVSGAAPLTALAWTGLVGGALVVDVAGRTTFSGTGPHMDASRRGFRGGAQGLGSNSQCCNLGFVAYRSTDFSLGGSKGEGIAGTPRYTSNSIAGAFDSGTRFTDAVGGFTDNNPAMSYLNGDFMRGAPANAGGGGDSHNASGGGGGNGGQGGNGSQTYNGDGLRDVGGYGGSRTPQDGILLASRIFMGGGGGSGSLNNDSGNRAEGGNGGGIIILRTGSISGAGVLASDGQRGWDSDAPNDPGGGGGAGGSVLVIAGSGHGNISVRARGGNGSDSNMETSNLASAPPGVGVSQGNCCGNEQEGPGGGGGGGAVYANSTLGTLSLGGGINGLSRADKNLGNSGNMLANPGATGNSLQTIAASSIVGAREGYACSPALTVNKLTTTPLLAVPPNTSGTYIINISNSTTLSGVAYGVALTDVLSSPFLLTGTTASVVYSTGASGPVSPMTITGTGTVAIGAAGSPSNAFTLAPGANVTATFKVGLNSATAGTYQNPAIVNYTDPTRTTGGNTSVVNPAVSPGGVNAAGGTVPGSNYASGSSTQEDIVITGVAGTSADLGLTKTGPTAAEVGQAVQYTLSITNSGPSNVTGSITISDSVPAAIGTVTWVCTLVAGVGDCDTSSSAFGASGSGNAIVLNKVSLNSGGQLQIVISGTAATASNITNTATVTVPAGYTDPNPSNNTGTASTSITTPTADLSATKSDGVSSVATNGATAYTIVVTNAGPSAANNSVVTDPATAGLKLLSVTCSAAGGAVCPAGLNTTTFQAGATIPTFPALGALTFTANAQVTASTGTVTNTVSVAGPAGLLEINTANNSASDADAVTPQTVAVVSAAQVCPAGSTEQLTNLLTNSDYANTAAGVGSSVTQYAINTAPTDPGVAIQTGSQNYGPNVVVQAPFPGDAARSVAGTNNWLYNEGNASAGGAAYRIWSQTVTGLTVGTSYEWMYYGSNALNRGSAATILPTIEFRVVNGSTPSTLAANSFANEAAGTSDTWTLRQSVFSSTATSLVLQLWDTAAATNGDSFASTQVILRECKPNTDPFVTKTDGLSQVNTFGTTNYVITVGNTGPGPADGTTVKDPAATGLNKTAISCLAVGTGATCPPSTTVAGIEGTGLVIPSLPINTTVFFTVTASVTALNGTVTNSVSLQLPATLTDSNLANNSASDADAVKGAANISVTKTNGGSNVLAGGTTAYTITVANAGPSNASGAVISDSVSSGLSCTTPATCTASGGASCAASIPIATLLSGYTIPGLPAGGQISLVVNCSVTATGQ
jgi:uncharacterized repeat protein (TIGR01451 family)